MNSSLMGIRIMGDADYTLYANQALLDMFGYKNIDELRASPPQEHYTPESRAAFLRRHEQFHAANHSLTSWNLISSAKMAPSDICSFSVKCALGWQAAASVYL